MAYYGCYKTGYFHVFEYFTSIIFSLDDIIYWFWDIMRSHFLIHPSNPVYEGVSKSFWTKSIMKYILTEINLLRSNTKVWKLTRLTHKIAIQLHVVAESCTICSSRSRQPVWKLSDTPSYSIKLYNILLGKPEGNRPLRRPRHKQEDKY
jgi:hypothetical protein